MQDIKNTFTYNASTGAIEQAITGSAASSQEIQLATSGLHLGHGNGGYLCAVVTEDFTNLTSLNIQLRDAAATGMGSARVVAPSGEIVLAKLKAGKCVLNRKLPGAEYNEFIDVYFAVTGTNPNAGKIIAWIQESPFDAVEEGF